MGDPILSKFSPLGLEYYYVKDKPVDIRYAGASICNTYITVIKAEVGTSTPKQLVVAPVVSWDEKTGYVLPSGLVVPQSSLKEFWLFFKNNYYVESK